MRRTSILHLLFIAIFTVSCASRVETTERLDLSNGGAIQLKLESSSALTKLAEVPTPSAEEFIIQISSTTADQEGLYPIVFEKQYGEMPLSIVLKEGEYNITASSGVNEPFSTTAPTYITSKKTVIEVGQISNVSLTAVIHSYLVDIVYTEEFKKAFTDYYIEAHVVDDRYSFASMGDQVAYLAPGSTKLVLKGMTATGQAYSSVIKEISSAGRERYVLTLAIRPQGQPFDVTVDTEVEQIGVGGNIDDTLYPYMDEITAGALSYTETVTEAAGAANSAIKLYGSVLITDVELTFKDENLLYLGLEKDHVYHFNNADDVAALNAAGMAIDAAAVVGKRSATLDMAAFSSRFLTFDNQPSQYTAHIKVVDHTGETKEKELTFNVVNPTISLDEVTAGNSWSYSADIPAKVTVITGDADYINTSNPNLEYQLSTDQLTWTKAPQSTPLKGLTPSTTYFLRAVYRGHIMTETRSFTTEATPQVPNAGMEDWIIDFYRDKYNHYKPWNNSTAEWWNTSNPRCFTYNGIGTEKNSPTSVLYTRANAISGEKTAEIRSVQIDVGGRANVVGKLLAGTLTSGSPNGLVSGSNNPENITPGRPFTARPNQIRFWIKYNQYGTDNYVITVQLKSGETVIGETFATGNTISEYTKMTIDIPYTNTELKATSLYICFASSKDGSFSYRQENLVHPDGKGPLKTTNYGSVLYIDDIELLYK